MQASRLVSVITAYPGKAEEIYASWCSPQAEGCLAAGAELEVVSGGKEIHAVRHASVDASPGLLGWRLEGDLMGRISLLVWRYVFGLLVRSRRGIGGDARGLVAATGGAVMLSLVRAVSW